MSCWHPRHSDQDLYDLGFLRCAIFLASCRPTKTHCSLNVWVKGCNGLGSRKSPLCGRRAPCPRSGRSTLFGFATSEEPVSLEHPLLPLTCNSRVRLAYEAIRRKAKQEPSKSATTAGSSRRTSPSRGSVRRKCDMAHRGWRPRLSDCGARKSQILRSPLEIARGQVSEAPAVWPDCRTASQRGIEGVPRARDRESHAEGPPTGGSGKPRLWTGVRRRGCPKSHWSLCRARV